MCGEGARSEKTPSRSTLSGGERNYSFSMIKRAEGVGSSSNETGHNTLHEGALIERGIIQLQGARKKDGVEMAPTVKDDHCFTFWKSQP